MTRLYRLLLAKMAQTIQRYDLLAPSDRILVAVSGGKDSMALWQLLRDYCKSIEPKISLYAAHIDAGFSNGTELQRELTDYFQQQDMELIVCQENFGVRVLQANQTKNPCFLCSRARRKSLYQLANRLHCNRIALAHQRDDVIETFLLNVFYSREIATMLAKQPVFAGRFYLIRPLWEIEESMLRSLAKERQYPLFKNPCPIAGKSKRQNVKEIIQRLELENGHVKDSLFRSLFHVNQQFLPTTVKEMKTVNFVADCTNKELAKKIKKEMEADGLKI